MNLIGHDDNEISRAMHLVPATGCQACELCGDSFADYEEIVEGEFALEIPVDGESTVSGFFCSEQCGRAWKAKHSDELGLAR